MNKIYLLTSTYPYGFGEQFLEHEIPYWEGKPLTIFPTTKTKDIRKTKGIEVKDDLLVGTKNNKLKFSDIINIITDKYFWLEAITFKPKLSLRAWKSLFIDTILSNRLANNILKNKNFYNDSLIIYCYWSNWILRGAALAKFKNKNLNYKIITRSHRADLYAYARPGGYFPFRHSFHKKVDHYFPVSQDGKKYLIENYGIPKEKITVARLGVPGKKNQTELIKTYETTTLISVSYLKQIKRIDRIIDALSILKNKNLTEKINWIHIGNGPLYEDLKNRAKNKEVTCDWKGLLPNSDVMKVLQERSNNAIFINVSDSEGVPVSIMEALSYGIPVIATDVGGSSEILCKENGIIIKPPFTIESIADAIESLLKDKPTKEAVIETFLENCSNKNFIKFIEKIENFQ